MANRKIHFKWSSLVKGKSGGYELHVIQEATDPTGLEQIVEKHNLSIKEASELSIIYKKH